MECQLQPTGVATFVPLLAQHLATIAAYAAALRAVRRSVDTSHPVFALVHQQIVVVLVCLVLNLANLVAIQVLEGTAGELAFTSYVGVAFFAYQFQQITWLAVTSLRYYLLYVAEPAAEIDFARLRRRAFAAVWIAEFLLLPVLQVPWALVLLRSGWPTKTLSALRSKDPALLWKLFLPSYVLMNAPDYASVALYVRMRYLDRKSRQVHPVNPDVEEEREVHQLEEGGQFGGIWVGEASSEGREMHVGEPEASSDQETDPGSCQFAASGGATVNSSPPPRSALTAEDGEEPAFGAGEGGQVEVASASTSETTAAAAAAIPPTAEQARKEKQRQQSRAVAKMIKVYALLALIDLYSIVLDLVLCAGVWGRIASYTWQMLTGYWFSLCVLSLSFRQIGGMWRNIL